jgi:hypothetical protein
VYCSGGLAQACGIAGISVMFSFIETKLFTRLVQEHLSDEEYRFRSN